MNAVANIEINEIEQYVLDTKWYASIKGRVARMEAFEKRFKESDQQLRECRFGRVWKEYGSARQVVDQGKLKSQFSSVWRACVREVTPISVKVLVDE